MNVDIIQYNVTMVVEVPDVGATDDEIEEWIEFNANYSGSISTKNPLHSFDMDTNWIEIERH